MTNWYQPKMLLSIALKAVVSGTFGNYADKRELELNPHVPYERHVIPEYGHIDCIFGKNAYIDVYPFILKHLNKYCG